MPGPQTYAATLDERLYGDKRRYTTHLCRRFVFLPLLSPSPLLQFRFLVERMRGFLDGFQKEEGKNFGMHIIEKYSGDFWRDLLEIR